MPRGDGTGPMGQGPMTGRAAGLCAGFSTPGFANSAPRMGMGFRRGAVSGRGKGRGGGFGRVQAPTQPVAQPAQAQQLSAQATNPVAPQSQMPVQSSRDQEIQNLKNRLDALEEQINQIGNAISQM